MIPTTFEQQTEMYDLNNKSVITWGDWAEKLVETCERIGWTVEPGPGTGIKNFYFENQIWYDDEDWSQKEGEYKYNFSNYRMWLNFAKWNTTIFNKGIDKTSTIAIFNDTIEPEELPKKVNMIKERFDIIIYPFSNKMIGIRIKFPVFCCMVNYPMARVPVFTIYNNQLKEISYRPNVFPTIGANIPCFSFYRPLTQKQQSVEDNTIKWIIYNIFFMGKYFDNNEYVLKSYKGINKIIYQMSKNKITSYFCITGKINNQEWNGIKIISTVLENNEEIIIIEPFIDGATESSLTLEQIHTTLATVIASTDPNTPNIYHPQRPYRQIVSQDNRFYVTRALLPGQTSLCKDLYYVVKKDKNETIGSGTYIMVKDENNANMYLRIIPFGTQYVAESAGENCTYLAFPVVAPSEEEQNND